MEKLLRFPSSAKHDVVIDAWFDSRGELGSIAKQWFEVIRGMGDDVRELLHDGHPTACVGDAAFGYVNSFTSHVNVGFFRGSELTDPDKILEGSGKFMRHVKIRPNVSVNAEALTRLINDAYTDIKRRIRLRPDSDEVLVKANGKTIIKTSGNSCVNGSVRGRENDIDREIERDGDSGR
jgi:hypothetical protein